MYKSAIKQFNKTLQNLQALDATEESLKTIKGMILSMQEHQAIYELFTPLIPIPTLLLTDEDYELVEQVTYQLIDTPTTTVSCHYDSNEYNGVTRYYLVNRIGECFNSTRAVPSERFVHMSEAMKFAALDVPSYYLKKETV
jgi:hypothetical protein